MNITKKIVWFFLFIVLSSFVCAEMVYVLNLHYEDDVITLIDKKIDYGNSPDRLIQREVGFRAELLDGNDDKIESFRFLAPNEEFVDYSEDGKFKAEENVNVWYKIKDKQDYMNYLKGIIEQKLAGN